MGKNDHGFPHNGNPYSEQIIDILEVFNFFFFFLKID